ncbi:hypothetical protein [Ileibacterium valens]|uniref:hypothetical protein n=1 Tax=Ileibacterium valens TaxID=1862668 RepID=UPI00272A68E3|nr:hypothetical protein [Ileibacterium valens]
MIGSRTPLKDVYTEFSTGMLPPLPLQKVLRNLLIASGVLLLIYTVLFYPILWTFSLLFFVLAYYYNRSLKFEYEYLIYNDDIHIDKIIANLKRKRKFAGNLQQLKVFTDDPKELNPYRKNAQRMRIRRLNDNRQKTYAMLFSGGDGLECVYINANDEVIRLIKSRQSLAVKLKNSDIPVDVI